MPHKIGVKGAADGGWSWLIVLAAFTVQFVVIGVHNLFGLLYIELLKESNADEAVVGKDFNASYLSQKYIAFPPS